MEVGQQVGHLLVRKATIKGRHHSLSDDDDAADLGIRGGFAAGKRRSGEEAVEVGRNLFERQVVVAMAVGAADFIKMLPFRLLGSELGFGMASSWTDGEGERCCGVEERLQGGWESCFAMSQWNWVPPKC